MVVGQGYEVARMLFDFIIALVTCIDVIVINFYRLIHKDYGEKKKIKKETKEQKI